jgi:hypothetical protein
MRTTYTQVPNSEIEAQESSYPIARPYCLSIPWSLHLVVTTLSLLFNVVLVTGWLTWKDGGLCREALYCEFMSLSSMCTHPHVTLAPVDVGLENSPTKFQSFYVQNQSIFDMPPSPEVDAAWEALYARSWKFYWNFISS